MTALNVFLAGIGVVLVAGVVLFVLMLAKYYLTPIVGEFHINGDPEKDVDALYGIKFEQHPLEFRHRKTVRLTVVFDEPKKK